MDKTRKTRYKSKYPDFHLLVADPFCVIFLFSEQENSLNYLELSAKFF
jgi:hypothetical protein